MRNPKLHYKDVESAILAMHAEGQKITADTILAKLGRGSKSTIHTHLSTWRNAQPMVRAEPKRLSEVVQKAIAREIEEVELKAVAALSSELADSHRIADALALDCEKAEERANALETELLKEQQDKATLTALIEEKESSLRKLTVEKYDLQSRIDRLNVELAKSELKLEGYQELKVEIKEMYVKLQAALVEAAELRGYTQNKIGAGTDA